MVKPTVTVKKVVYQKNSLKNNERRMFAPAYSEGTLNKKDKHLDLTIHLTPEAKNKPSVKNALIRHELHEGHYIASGMPVTKAHKMAVKKDPKYGQDNWWSHLGY